MAKYEQGTVSAVMFINGEVLFAFREGKLELKDEKAREYGSALHEKLIVAGAICVDHNSSNGHAGYLEKD